MVLNSFFLLHSYKIVELYQAKVHPSKKDHCQPFLSLIEFTLNFNSKYNIQMYVSHIAASQQTMGIFNMPRSIVIRAKYVKRV